MRLFNLLDGKDVLVCKLWRSCQVNFTGEVRAPMRKRAVIELFICNTKCGIKRASFGLMDRFLLRLTVSKG